MAFIAPLVQGPYNKTRNTPASSFPPMHLEQLRKAASQCWEGTSSSLASTGQRSETCPRCADAPCPPCCLHCLLRHATACGH